MDRKQRHNQSNSEHVNGQSSSRALIYGVLGLAGGYLIYRMATREKGQFLSAGKSKEVNLRGSVNIDRPAEEIYNFWRGFTQLPKVMTFLERIEERGDDITHWVVKTPLGAAVEWDSKVVDDVPHEHIAWQSVEGSDIRTWGNVRFESKGKSTKVLVNLNFEPPGANVGATIGQFLSGLEKAALNKNLRDLKAFMETGEVPTNLRQQRPREHRQDQPMGQMQ